MADINVAELKPVGEFGSKAWCEACSHYSVLLFEDEVLPADLQWGFSEIYTYPPARLVSEERPLAAYYIMVRDGKVTAGDGAPEECRALPGFHVELQWAAICNQSRSLYGRDGQRQRSLDEQVMFREIQEYVGKSNPLGLKSRAKPYWPAAVATALGKGSEEGGGLHNIAASLQAPSPEFNDMPVTDLGVPIFSKMSESQKQDFLKLCGVHNE